MSEIYPPPSVCGRYSRSYDTITALRNHSPANLAYLDRDVRAQSEHLTHKIAVHDQANARIDELKPHSQHRWSKKTQQTVEFTITLIGAFTFSTIPQILGAASNRGPLAVLAGLVGGAAVAWFTHDRANKGLGVLRCAHHSRQALKVLETRQSQEAHQNFLTEAYFNRRKDLLWEVEAESLSASFPWDLWGAIVATILEIGAAFWVTLPAGLVVALLAAGFPAAVIWLSSVFQSERVDFAEWALIKSRTYQQYCPPEDNTPNGDRYIVVTDAELQEVTATHARFNYFIAVNTNGIQTPQGAEAQALRTLAEQEMTAWAEAHQTAHQTLVQAQRQATERVRDRYNVSDFQTAGRRADAVTQDRNQAIEDEKQRLQAIHEEEQKELKQTYGTTIQRWDGIRLKQQQEFDRWERQGQA